MYKNASTYCLTFIAAVFEASSFGRLDGDFKAKTSPGFHLLHSDELSSSVTLSCDINPLHG